MVENSEWLSENGQGEQEELPAAVVTSSSPLDNGDSSSSLAESTLMTQNDIKDENEPPNKESNHPNNNNNTSQTNATKFEVGDHIYSWCSYLGIPRVYTHHGIVIERDDDYKTVTILDFSCLVDDSNRQRGSGPKSMASWSTTTTSEAESSSASEGIPPISGSSSSSVCGSVTADTDSILRSYTIDHSDASKVWHRVKYEATLLEKVTRRAGTVSRGSSDTPAMVLARTNFLQQNHHLLSSYNLNQSNCEHVAVWCKTGHYSSLQLLAGMGHSLVVSATPVVAVSTATTTVSAGGLWGWLGYTTTVSLAATMPWLIPVAMLPTAVAAGKSVFDTTRWKQKTAMLNETFEDWKSTIGDMDYNYNNNEPVGHKLLPLEGDPPMVSADTHDLAGHQELPGTDDHRGVIHL